MKQLFTAFILFSTLLVAQNPLTIPDTVSGSNMNLTIQQGSVPFYTVQNTSTFGINGNILGPTLIMNKNYSVTINLHNTLTDTTTIHWHGMHVSALNDGGPHITIPPTTTWSPSFKVIAWAGTYWYHPHMHMHTNDHVQKGIAGFVIVRDSIERNLQLPRTYGKDDFPMVIQTKAFDANKQIIVNSALDTALMVNATLKPYLNAPAQVVRMRLLNGSSERVYNLGFTGNKIFYQIASDGGLLTAPVSMTRLRLSPGERAEILIDLAPYNGQSFDMISFGAELPNAIYGAAQPGMGPGQVIPSYSLNPLNGNNFTVLKLNVVPPLTNPVTTIPTTLTTHTPWTQTSAAITRSITFMPVNMGPTAIQGPFMFNNQMFNMAVVNYTVPFNNIEIWQLTNQTPIAHPFHIHDIQFYVLDVNGVPPTGGQAGRKDVVLVPAGNGVVRFITKFETFCNDTAKYMYHCHMLTHEDMDMMGQFVVSCPSGVGIDEKTFNERSNIYPNPAKDKLTIKQPNNTIETMIMTDLVGNIMQTHTFSEKSNEIDISLLNRGIYFIHLNNANTTFKLIKE
jgi:blue copper oxidase